MPLVQPRPRKVTCSGVDEAADAVAASSASTARACSATGREVLAERGAQQRQGRRGEPGLHDGLLVDVVEQDRRVGALGHRACRPSRRSTRAGVPAARSSSTTAMTSVVVPERVISTTRS